jgi:hypothetical protein
VANGSDRAELTSLQSQLDELTRRLIAVGDHYRDSPDSLVVAELDSAERSLLTARRALERAISTLA